jgi:hypothetical protein
VFINSEHAEYLNMAKQEHEPTMAEVLSRMTAIMEEQAKANQKDAIRAEREDLDTVEARRAGRSLGATGVYENRLPPDISAYNPKGERDNPRPELRCKMIWVGFKLSATGLSREEIELLNQVQPGDYRVTKSDGSTIDFTVTAKMDRKGKLELVSFHFPCKSVEDRHNHMPMRSYLKEVVEQQAQAA